MLSDKFSDLYYFSSFFYPSLRAHGCTQISRWFRNENIFSYRVVFIPCCLNSHWTLVVIDNQRKSVDYYDSMKGQNFPLEIINIFVDLVILYTSVD